MGTDTFEVHSDRPLHAEAAELREVLRIGDPFGRDELVFTSISAFAVGPEGQIYIADLRGELRAFDPTGEFVRTIARRGEGPGELVYVVNLAVSPSGEIAAHDLSNGRISRFSPDGRLIRQLNRPVGMARYSRDGLSYDAEGNLWVGINPSRSLFGEVTQSGRPVYARVQPNGAYTDTAYVPNGYWEACPHRSQMAYSRGFIEDVREPYLPKVKWYWSGHPISVLGCPNGYRFDVVGERGGMIHVSRAWEPEKVMSEEAAFVRTQVARFPIEKPAYHRFWTASDGRVWVWRSGHGKRFAVSEELQARGAPAFAWDYDSNQGFDVFTPNGRWLGEVNVPASYAARPFPGRRDPYFRGDTLWAVTTDELGAEYLSRFIVEWPS